MIPQWVKNKETSNFVKSTTGMYVDNTTKNILNTRKYFLPLNFGIDFTIGSVTIPQYSKRNADDLQFKRCCFNSIRSRWKFIHSF